MPLIKDSQLGQPKQGNIQLVVLRPPNGSPTLYLEVPMAHLAPLCTRPRKYLRYIGWCIMGVEGRVARDSPLPIEDIGDEGGLESGSVYSYRIPEEIDPFARAIHMGAINPRSTPSRFTTQSQVSQDRQVFRQALEQRDMCCIMSGNLSMYNASHIIPYAHEDACIGVIINSRLDYNEDVASITVNDIRNGVLVNPMIHNYLESRKVAFLKTPNTILNIGDIPTNTNRQLRAGTAYPDGERFTLHLIEILDNIDRSNAVQTCNVGQHAAFRVSEGTNVPNLAKPSGLLLHYNYGAAVVRWWGHHVDILRSQFPPQPPPPPPPPRRRRRRRSPESPPAAGPSSNVPRYLEPYPTTINDRSVAIKKHERPSKLCGSKKKGVQNPSAVGVVDEPARAANESKVWESWDEDGWMLYCMLSTKSGRERYQDTKEESMSNVRAWAQDVSEHQSAKV